HPRRSLLESPHVGLFTAGCPSGPQCCQAESLTYCAEQSPRLNPSQSSILHTSNFYPRSSRFTSPQARNPDLLRRQPTNVPRLEQADDVSGIIDSNGLLDRVVQRRRQDGVQIGPLPVLPDDPYVDVRLVDGREHNLPVVVNVRRRETRPQ